MTVRQITTTPGFQSGVFSRPYLVRNSGDTTVYLGQDSSLTVQTRNISLPAGASLNWEGETELWAMVESGVGELEVLYDANSAFTPGPTSVGINGPVQVFGTVAMNGRAYFLGNFQGTLNRSTVTPAYIDGVQVAVFLDIPDDVQTIRFEINNDRSSVGDDVGRYYAWLEWQEEVTPGIYTTIYSEAVASMTGSRAFLTIPKRTNTLNITVCNPQTNPAFMDGATIRIRVSGFTSTLPQTYYNEVFTIPPGLTAITVVNQQFSQLSVGSSGIFFNTQAPLGNSLVALSTFMGTTDLHLELTSGFGAGTTVDMDVFAYSPETVAYASSTRILSARGLVVDDIKDYVLNLPALPILFRFRRSAAVSGTIALTLTSRNY